MLRKFAAITALALLLPAFAADLNGEIVTAGTHAQLAAKASDIGMVHMHLHHTLNCLVGPKGAGFDAKEMNPCANSGNGAIPDSTDAAKIAMLQDAVKTTQAGLGSDNIAVAQEDASMVAAQLMAKK